MIERQVFVTWHTPDEKLPPAHPEKRTEERTETRACDLISRAMLLEYIHNEPVGKMLCDKYNLDGVIKQLPSVQPDVPDTNVGDIISRQAAIDDLDEWIDIYGENKCVDAQAILKQVKRSIKKLPSAQPEPCEDDPRADVLLSR